MNWRNEDCNRSRASLSQNLLLHQSILKYLLYRNVSYGCESGLQSLRILTTMNELPKSRINSISVWFINIWLGRGFEKKIGTRQRSERDWNINNGIAGARGVFIMFLQEPSSGKTISVIERGRPVATQLQNTRWMVERGNFCRSIHNASNCCWLSFRERLGGK